MNETPPPIDQTPDEIDEDLGAPREHIERMIKHAKSERKKDSLHTGCKGRLILKTAPLKRRYGVWAEPRATYTHNGRQTLYTL